MSSNILAVITADENNIISSFEKCVNFLEKNESGKLNGFYASDYCYIKKHSPELFEKVKSFVESERLQPLGGMWKEYDGKECSTEFLSRNILFSQKFFIRNFGRTFRTAYGKKIENFASVQLLYGGKINAYIMTGEKHFDSLFWWDSESGYRILAVDECSLNIKSIDEIGEDDTTVTFDEYFREVYNSMTDIPDILLDNIKITEENETEKLLLKAEKVSTVNTLINHGEDRTKLFLKLWKKYIAGDLDFARSNAEKIIAECKNAGIEDDCIAQINNENVRLLSFKLCADKMGDTIIRVCETGGKTKRTMIKCDISDCAFYVDIEPYEVRCFKVGEDGITVEANTLENIEL